MRLGNDVDRDWKACMAAGLLAWLVHSMRAVFNLAVC